LNDAETTYLLGVRPLPFLVAPVLATKHPGPTVDAVDETLSQLEGQPGSGPWLAPLIDTVLELLAANERALARRLFARLRLHLARSGVRPVRWDAARWLLLTELMELPPGLPEGLPVALAPSLRDLHLGDGPLSPSPELAIYLSIHQRELTYAARRFHKAAPNVYQLLRPILVRWGVSASFMDSPGVRFLLLALAMVFAVWTRHALCDTTSPGIDARELPEVQRMVERARLSTDMGPSQPAAERHRLRDAARGIVRHFCDGGDQRFCADLVRLQGPLRGERCVDARVSLLTLDEPDGRFAQFLPDPRDRETLSAAVDAICPAPSDASTTILDADPSGVQPQPSPGALDEASP